LFIPRLNNQQDNFLLCKLPEKHQKLSTDIDQILTQRDKLIVRILAGTSDKNIDFNDLTRLLDSFSFSYRVKGSHYIYFKEGIEEIVNIQPLSNNKAKSYQVKQIRLLILKYKLNLVKNE